MNNTKYKTDSLSPYLQEIDRRKFDDIAVSQYDTNLCWTASVELILRFYDFGIGGLEFLMSASHLGTTSNQRATTATISDLFESYNFATANFERYLDEDTIFSEIESNSPILIVYQPSLDSEGQHAVVIVGYTYTHFNNAKHIEELIIRDPRAEEGENPEKGRKLIAYSTMDIKAYWIIL